MSSDLEKNRTETILQTIENEIDFSAYKSIYVGFSGGADSTALLILLNELSAKYKFELNAVHFEHGLRGKESLLDAAWCREFCSNLNIPIKEINLKVKSRVKIGEGVEACARRLRIESFQSLINPDTDAIALGHHLDDKIENLFIRLIRGSNASGLTSLRSISTLKGMKVLRPLLEISKTQIESFLKHKKIDDWRIDHTNHENLYRRNIIRNQILPLLYKEISESKSGLIRAEQAIRNDADFLELTAKNEYKKLFIQNNFPYKLNINNILNLHPAILVRVLRYWLTDILGFEFIPTRNLIKRINIDLQKKQNKAVLIPLFKENFLRIENKSISLFEPKNNPDSKGLKLKTWNWKEEPILHIKDYEIKAEIIENFDKKKLKSENYAYFDYAVFPNSLLVKSWEDGDRLIPYGSNETIKVKRVFKNNKIPSEIRKLIPLICLQDKTIIWIVGWKRSNFAPVNSKTNTIVFLTMTH